jgi:phosphoadenosine phosphosulfate reductase
MKLLLLLLGTNQFFSMDISSIRYKIEHYLDQGKTLFSTSSFQTHSVVLLHILSRTDRNIPVYFINTGYHFAETIMYKDEVAAAFGLRVVNLNPFVPKTMQRNKEGNLLFTSDPDYCCYLNKVQPVEGLLDLFDVWISGVRADQNSHRQQLQEEIMVQKNTLRYHPVLHWTHDMVEAYIEYYGLPRHPLEEKGYSSIGCEPCTRPAEKMDLRGGRWYGQKKTECGLNADLVERKI